jgi:hypothetical protein
MEGGHRSFFFLEVAMNIRVGVVALLLGLFWSPPAAAFLNPIVISPNIVPSIPLDPNAAGIAPQGDGSGGEGEAAVVSAPKEIFAYRHSRERTQQNLRNFVARIPVDAGRAELAQALAAQPTIIDDIAAGMRTYGFDPHNVADAYAVWLINVWGASEKRNIEPDAATVAAVKQQVYAALASTPNFAATSDAERQEFAEALLLQSAMFASTFEQNKNSPALLDQLAAAARKGAIASYGIDLTKMTLTPNGFVPRKGG